MRSTLRIISMVGAAGLACASGAWAHDFWIEPGSFTPKAQTSVQVRLRVGERFRGDSVARVASRIELFEAVGPQGGIPIEGAEGADPAGSLRVDRPGLVALVYRSRRAFLELAGPKFEDYLAEEGLESIIRMRAERGESGKPSRELYSRCAKSLLAVGGLGTGDALRHDRPLGLPLELVAERNPYTMPLGPAMPILVLYQDRPLPGALVVALHSDDPTARLSGRTDGAGRVLLPLARPGVWLIKSVHMVQASDRRAADWESLWASLTFQIPAPEPP